MYPSSIATIQDARRGFAKSKKRGGSIAPSPKAQEVFRRVVVNCEKQCDVAEDLKISSGRVSQHVRRVRQWLAAGSPGDPETTAQQQQRLDRAVAKARHEAILAFAMSELRRLAAIHRHATTRIEEKEGENTKVVTTYRDQALSVQHLKVAQRAVIELAKLAELDPLPPPRPVMPSDHDLFRAVRDVLCDWRQRAEHLGHVPQSNWEELVGAVIAAVIGRNRDPLPLDEPAREFIDNLLRGNAACSPSKPSAGPVEAESTAGSPADSSQAGGSPEETCIVPPIPRDPAWNPFVTGAFAFLSEPTVRHPRGEGTLADSTPKTERQSD